MTRHAFFPAAMVGMLLAFAGSLVFNLLAPLLTVSTTLRLMMSVLGLVYLVWLMHGSRRRTGRATAIGGWLVLSAVAWFAAPTVASCLLMHALAIWLIRSFFCYGGVLPALLDLAVSVSGVVAAAWALGQTGSVFLAVWCFFLVQALFSAIPTRIPRSRGKTGDASRENDAFDRARRRADAAFRQLIVRTSR